ncbi:hypothetical protein M5K25_015963 [Dendrobium thyrsiflorum]|uniref:Transmembrane protein n=1 Tax=Dendrobium thyrsiflorum TaxID=117978 RepID=A0ABD0UYL0_DENTH
MINERKEKVTSASRIHIAVRVATAAFRFLFAIRSTFGCRIVRRLWLFLRGSSTPDSMILAAAIPVFFQIPHVTLMVLSTLSRGDFPYTKSWPLFSVEIRMGNPASTIIPLAKGDRPAVQQEVPAKSDHAYAPLPGFLTVYEFSLRVGLRFAPASKLIDILWICGVSLSQLSYRAMSIIMRLIVFFRDRRVVLSLVCLSRMGRLISDTQGRISFRPRWLDIRTQDPLNSWVNDFFFVQNDWNLQEKWEKLKNLLIPLHTGEEDLLKMLNLPDFDNIHYEVRYLSRYVDEEYLFKVGLSIQAGRSHAHACGSLSFPDRLGGAFEGWVATSETLTDFFNIRA